MAPHMLACHNTDNADSDYLNSSQPDNIGVHDLGEIEERWIHLRHTVSHNRLGIRVDKVLIGDNRLRVRTLVAVGTIDEGRGSLAVS